MAAETVTLEEYRARLQAANGAEPQPVTVEDFYSYLPSREFIFVPTRDLWRLGSVNARCPLPLGPDGKPVMKLVKRKKGGAETFEEVPVLPAEWLDQNRPIEQMTWAPGEPMVISGRLVSDGGWIERAGCSSFNLYRPPLAIQGDPMKAGRWIEHVRYLYPDGADHIIRWLAHRVQRPDVKINHALVLGGVPGIGKDTVLEPVKYGVGPWNFAEVNPSHILGRFNGFVKSVILRISEAHDLGEFDRYSFYEHMKALIAAPPDVIRCDEKNIREHSVFNVCGVIITTNHKTDGIYLPADDRRHSVHWSDRKQAEFAAYYFQEMFAWYASEGTAAVVAYLKTLDLSGFDAKAPPVKTAAFWDVVDANRAPEDAELADAVDLLSLAVAQTRAREAARPEPRQAAPIDVLTIGMLASYASDSFRTWLTDRKNSRQIPHRMEAAGYASVRNDSQGDGRWKVSGQNVVIYALQSLSVRDRIAAARQLCSASRP
jgi:hypothetical protein